MCIRRWTDEIVILNKRSEVKDLSVSHDLERLKILHSGFFVGTQYITCVLDTAWFGAYGTL